MYIRLNTSIDLSKYSAIERNSLLEWQWVKKSNMHVLSYPLDTHILTFDAIESDTGRSESNIKMTIENSDSCMLENLTALAEYLLWKDVFLNDTESYLCRRTQTDDSLEKSFLFNAVMVWVGYDLSCSYYKKHVIYEFIEKEISPMQITIVCILLAFYYPLIFSLIEISPIFNKFKKVPDDFHNKQVTEYKENDLPYGFQRAVLKLCYLSNVEHKQNNGNNRRMSKKYLKGIAACRLTTVFFLILLGFSVMRYYLSYKDHQAYDDVYRLGIPFLNSSDKFKENCILYFAALALGALLLKLSYMLMSSREIQIGEKTIRIENTLLFNGCHHLHASHGNNEDIGGGQDQNETSLWCCKYTSYEQINSNNDDVIHCCCKITKPVSDFLDNGKTQTLTNDHVTHDDANNATHDDANNVTHDDANNVIHDDANNVTHDDANNATHDDANNTSEGTHHNYGFLTQFLDRFVNLVSGKYWKTLWENAKFCCCTCLCRTGDSKGHCVLQKCICLISMIVFTAVNILTSLFPFFWLVLYGPYFFANCILYCSRKKSHRCVLGSIWLCLRFLILYIIIFAIFAFSQWVVLCSTIFVLRSMVYLVFVALSSSRHMLRIFIVIIVTTGYVVSFLYRFITEYSMILKIIVEEKRQLGSKSETVTEHEFDSIIRKFDNFRNRVFFIFLKTLFCAGFCLVATRVLLHNNSIDDEGSDYIIKLAFIAFSPKLVFDFLKYNKDDFQKSIDEHRQQIRDELRGFTNDENSDDSECCECLGCNSCFGRGCTCCMSFMRCGNLCCLPRCHEYCSCCVCPLLSTFCCCKCTCNLATHDIEGMKEECCCCTVIYDSDTNATSVKTKIN